MSKLDNTIISNISDSLSYYQNFDRIDNTYTCIVVVLFIC